MRRAIRLAHHHVRMHLWLSLIQRYIPHQRQHLDLLGHPDPLVILFLPIEVTEGYILERADRGEVTGTQSLSLGKGCKPRGDLIPCLENDGKSLRAGPLD